eukprot:CAMPEP_0179293524 /NCGR_PEP_ID=MMETSP0797-20121207/43416_1 /TAXON_ID=47934 /ORGANISM="Dinophysis acuminata, Strain DAEP01" /LENGTH=96 /DNA_ID=CAMNT_0021002671 /DNA_START=77 /DNA_END=363 /DNA_ORIENTATION=-
MASREKKKGPNTCCQHLASLRVADGREDGAVERPVLAVPLSAKVLDELVRVVAGPARVQVEAPGGRPARAPVHVQVKEPRQPEEARRRGPDERRGA